MKIESVRTLAGPNTFTHHPVIVMDIFLEDLAGRESSEFPDFVGRLVALLPGLNEHVCSEGVPGGFVHMLHKGTYFGHIVEHVTLELLQLADIPRNFGRTVPTTSPGKFRIAVQYISEEGTRFLLIHAVELVEALLRGESYDVAPLIEEARTIVAETDLGPSTRAIVDAAAARNIPWIRIGTESLIQLGYSKYRKFIKATMSDKTSAVSVEIAQDKQLTKDLLEQAGVPVPRGEEVDNEKELKRAARDLGVPVTVKPLDGNHGRGVSINLSSDEELLTAFRIARSHSSRLIVEESFTGKDYRVLLLGGKVVSACERIPAHVVGDGSSTLKELIDRENGNRLRGKGHEKPLTNIVIDDVMEAFLAKRGIDLESHMPAMGETVTLRDSANMSTGGSAKDVTDSIHEENKALCERATRTIGLDICGIDLMLDDISKPPANRLNGVLEVNAAPGLRPHEMPSEGKGRRVGESIVKMIYPPGSKARIPIVSITGTNGKTTITRMIGFALEKGGLTVGMTTTDGIWIGGRLIKKGDMTGFRSARTVLSDPLVDVAVLETARGGIIRSGLGYDWSDVGVISNIQADHIGQDNIRDIEDILYVKSLVAERVREGGTLILNADDPYLPQLAEDRRVSWVKKKIVFFSLDPGNPVVRSHLENGGKTYYVKDEWIVEAYQTAENPIVMVRDVPVTMTGKATFNTANALAAAAACRALDVSADSIARALSDFTAHEQNVGRANLFCLGSNHVLLDYGHNPEAFNAVGALVQQTGKKSVGLIGLPGDRDDALIKEGVHRAALYFDSIVLKEDADTRGRARGELAALMAGTIEQHFPEKPVKLYLDEKQAFEKTLAELNQNELLVVFYDKLGPLVDVLRSNGARTEECFLEYRGSDDDRPLR